MNKLLLLILLISSPLRAKVIDRIVGIVGNEVISQSDIEEATILLQERDMAKVLDHLIEHKLLLICAEKETLTIKQEEISNAVEDAILKVRGRFLSDEEYELELSRSGLTEKDLRIKYTKEMRENLLIQKLFQKKFGKELAVSDIETIDFYNNYKDSIPPMPAAINFLGVDVYYSASNKAKNIAKKKANNILKRINKGESFSKLAKKYSDDPITSQRGGDLGTLNPMDLAPEFQSILINMKEGETKLTEIGNVYHIVQCNSKYEDLITLSDIMIKIQPIKADSEAIKGIIETVKENLEKEDMDAIQGLPLHTTKILNWGDGFIPLQKTPFSKLESIEIDKIYTFNTLMGFQIIKPIELREERMPTWEELRPELKELLYQQKMQMNYGKLIHKLKQDIFVKRML